VRCPVNAGCAAYSTAHTADFPAARPRRERPQREAQLLLVRDTAGSLLLERRPPAGIWGGLWCLPIAEAGEDAAAFMLRAYGLRAEVSASLPPIDHAFTHFDLRLRPLELQAREAATVAEQPGLRWINIAGEALPGLPAPVARLLRELVAGIGPPAAEAPQRKPRRKRSAEPVA
jgi:A/G-specific adenine glycosylase